MRATFDFVICSRSSIARVMPVGVRALLFATDSDRAVKNGQYDFKM